MARGIRGSCFEENKLKMEAIDFIADLEYFTTEISGRKTPASNGYRPHIMFHEYPEFLTSGSQYFLGKESVYPGDKARAGIKILITAYFNGRLYEHLNFSFFEGSNKIGKGTITEIVNKGLKINDLSSLKSINLNFYPEDILIKIHADYKEDAIKVIQAFQEFIILHESYRSPRIIRAIIALSEKNKNKVEKYIKMARTDWRDIIYLAEYKKKSNSETIRIKDFNKKFGEEII